MSLRCLPILLAVAVLGAADVEVALTSGRTVRGELIKDNDGSLTVRLRSPVRGGVKQVEATYPRNDILRRKDLPSLDVQYEDRRKATNDTVPDLCVLAQWCYENCLRERAFTHASKVLELDGDNAWAKHILDSCGYIAVDGKYVDEEKYLADTKQEKVDGQILPVAVAEARRALSRAVGARDSAAKRLATYQAILKDKPAAVAADEAKAKDAAAAADAAKKAYEAAKKKYDESGTQPLAKNETADKRQKSQSDMLAAVNKLVDKVNETKRASDAASRQLTSDKGALDRANAQIADCQAAVDKAVADIKEAAAKLPADDPAAKEALASLTETPKAIDAPKPGSAPATAGAPPAGPAKDPVRRLGRATDQAQQ